YDANLDPGQTYPVTQTTAQEYGACQEYQPCNNFTAAQQNYTTGQHGQVENQSGFVVEQNQTIVEQQQVVYQNDVGQEGQSIATSQQVLSYDATLPQNQDDII